MTDAVALTRQWTWIGAESVYPYWVVSRWAIAELRKWQALQEASTVRFHMEVVKLQLMNCTVGWNARTMAYAVNVPALANAVALREGEQLCLEVVPKAVTT